MIKKRFAVCTIRTASRFFDFMQSSVDDGHKLMGAAVSGQCADIILRLRLMEPEEVAEAFDALNLTELGQ